MSNNRIALISKRDYGRLLVYMVAFVPLFYKFISPFFILAGAGALTVYITPVVLFLGIMLCYKDFLSSIRFSDVALYIVIIVVAVLSSVFYPESSVFVNENIRYFSLSVVSYLFIGLVIQYDRDSDIIRIVAYIASFVLLFWQIWRILRLGEVNETADGFLGEQMEQGYMLLFPSCYLFVESLRNHRLFDIIVTIVSSILLLFMGARGPALLLVVFVASFLLLFHTYKKKNVLKKFFLVVFTVIVIFFYQPIILAVMPFATKLGFNERVFDSILYGNITNLEESSGRDEIYATLINAINSDQGVWGFGWGGDRRLTSGDLWAHNFELEVLVQFGWLFGGAMLILLIILLFRCFFKTRDTLTSGFLYVLFFWGLMELQLSYTYIRHPLFFLLLGYCISVIRTKQFKSVNK